jgi:preprotein translocase subunit YajC
MVGPAVTLFQNQAAEQPASTQNTANTTTPGAPGSQTNTPPPGLFDGGGMLLPLLVVIAIFYFLVFGPDRKNRKKREEMLKQIKKGDRVMTTGGMYATVAAVAEDEVTLQIADGVRARFTRAAIQTITPEEAAVDTKKH